MHSDHFITKKILKAPEIAPNEVHRNREGDHLIEPAGQHYIAERSFSHVSTVIKQYYDFYYYKYILNEVLFVIYCKLSF